jgi:hypothetical protein
MPQDTQPRLTALGIPMRSGLRWRFVLRICVLSAAAVGVVLGVAMLNNNFPRSKIRKTEFLQRLERTRQTSRAWVFGRDNASPETIRMRRQELFNNTALLHIVADCAQASGDDELRQLVQLYFEYYKGRHVWSRMVDPTKPYEAPSEAVRAALQEYQRWFLHAISRGEFALSSAESASLFDPAAHARVHLTHQVIALYLHRVFLGTTPEIDRLVPRLAQRIAREAALDFRVTDLYLQRIVCLLVSGQTQWLKPRWVERALTAQKADGGWTYSWFGWDTSLFRYHWRAESTTAHPTAQGMWIVYQLKYRHADWINRHCAE